MRVSPRPAVMHIRCFIRPRRPHAAPAHPLPPPTAPEPPALPGRAVPCRGRGSRRGREGGLPGMSPAAAAARFLTAVKMHLRKSTHTSPSKGLRGGT